MAEDKEILFHDDVAFKNKDAQEKQITESIYKLKQFYDKALGDKANVDYSKLVKEPTSYIVHSYWNAFCKDKAPHLNKVTIFTSDTGITEADIQNVHNEYKVSCNRMEHVHSVDALPIATRTDITFKENRYPKYLDESKKKQFELLKKFVAIANKLENTQGAINLVRYCPDLTTNGFKISVNLHRFIL